MGGYGSVIDDVWIVQTRHGPFDEKSAPSGQPSGESEDKCPSRQSDHWWPMLDLEDGSGRPTDVIIREFREMNGECKWICKLEQLLSRVNLGGKQGPVTT